MSYRSYMSYRVVLWHVADVPGVQGQLEVWKLGCLEVWFLCTTIVLSRACRALCFSVAVEGLALWACTLCSLGRASAPSPAGAWGSAPHPPISQSAKIPFVSLAVEGLALWACTVISKYSGSSIAAFSNQLISQSARRSGRAPVSSWRTEKELQENKKTALRRPLWDGARGGTRTPTDLSTCTSSMRVCHFTTRAVKNGT